MRKKHMQYEKRPVFFFSPAMVTIAQRAMELFEQSLQRMTSPPANRIFAKQMMQRVNGKLDAMRNEETRATIITFDYNEKLVLAAAVQLYEHLLCVSASLPHESEFAFCRQIRAFCGSHPQRETLLS